MRAIHIGLCLLLTACGMTSGVDLSTGPEIYLDGNGRFTVPAEMDRKRYACKNGPTICEKAGTLWECQCVPPGVLSR